ncbi:peptidoglycan-binding protein [Sorangium sp. So ce118]
MAVDYRVRSGECLISIAHDHGLSWEMLWNHPNNAEIKRLRGDPNILKEGDILHIPDRALKECTVATGAAHRFVVKRKTAMLRLRIVQDALPKAKPQQSPPAPSRDPRTAITEDPEVESPPTKDEPRAGVAYLLKVDGVTIRGTTDQDGMIACEIAPNAREGQLILEPDTPNETMLRLNLGHLDPIDEVGGVKQRLTNLTFDCGDTGDDMTPELESALRAFQEKHGLAVTGEIDQAMKDRLREVHGG